MIDTKAFAEVVAEVFQLERASLDPEVRRDRAQVEALLAQGFREFGASGRQWGRAEIIDLLESEVQQPEPRIEEFSLSMLAENVMLARIVQYARKTTAQLCAAPFG
jgi:hypothetical protein